MLAPLPTEITRERIEGGSGGDLSLLSVEVELELPAERVPAVEVEAPEGVPAAAALLLLRVQRVLAGVELLAHLCVLGNKGGGETSNKKLPNVQI